MNVVNIVQAIEEWAQKDPERIAYREDDLTYTYGQLAARSDQLAAYLEETLETRGPIVVYGELEFDMLTAFLAASKTGRAYIPIESTTPKERIELILSVVTPDLIISVADWQGPETMIPMLEINQLEEIYQSGRNLGTTKVLGKDDIYYIIFTSGTTGIPKGVQISHGNLLSFVQWTLKDFSLREGMHYLAQAPYSFDLSVMGLYPALTSGGCLVPLKKAVINVSNIVWNLAAIGYQCLDLDTFIYETMFDGRDL